MAWTHGVGPLFSEGQEGQGPQMFFAGALVLAVAAWAFVNRHLHIDLSMPVAATLLLAAAAFASVIGRYRRDSGPHCVTYWDVAGALTLIGISAAATIDPEQFVRAVETTGAGHPNEGVRSAETQPPTRMTN